MDQKSFALVGDVIFDHGVEGGVEKLPQFRPGLDSSTDQVAAVDGEHLERIGLPRPQQLVRHRAHLLNRLNVIEARRGLAKCVGTLKVHELVNQVGRVDSLTRKRAHHIEQAGALGAQRLVMVFDEQAHVAHQVVRERQAIHNDARLLGTSSG